MINVQFDGIEYHIKNEVTEFNVGEFERITLLINDETTSSLTRWTNILNSLGLPLDVIDNFDTFDFTKIINEFNGNQNDYSKYKYVEVITLQDNEYKLRLVDGELKLTVREMRIIEGLIKDNKDIYLSNILAVIYKRDDIQKDLQYDMAHIKYKSELISKLVTSDVVLPILSYLSDKLNKEINILNGGV
jgi:hypothetical protein